MFLNNSSKYCRTISDLMTHVLRNHILQKFILKINSRLRTKVKNEVSPHLYFSYLWQCCTQGRKAQNKKCKTKANPPFPSGKQTSGKPGTFPLLRISASSSFLATLYHCLVIFGLAIPLSMHFFTTASYNN